MDRSSAIAFIMKSIREQSNLFIVSPPNSGETFFIDKLEDHLSAVQPNQVRSYISEGITEDEYIQNFQKYIQEG
jgi:hypothetical protein